MSDINIYKILFYSSNIVWLFPAIRQFRGRYFLFFLVLALSDPINLLITWEFHIKILVLPVIITYVLFLSVISIEYLKKNFPILFVFFLVLMTPPFLSSKVNIIYTQLVLVFTLILMTILKTLITAYVEQKKLNLFYVVLIFYLLTLILKYFNLLLGFADAYAFFIITSIAQFAFGLFFSIFREDDSRLLV